MRSDQPSITQNSAQTLYLSLRCMRKHVNHAIGDAYTSRMPVRTKRSMIRRRPTTGFACWSAASDRGASPRAGEPWDGTGGPTSGRAAGLLDDFHGKGRSEPLSWTRMCRATSRRCTGRRSSGASGTSFAAWPPARRSRCCARRRAPIRRAVTAPCWRACSERDRSGISGSNRRRRPSRAIFRSLTDPKPKFTNQARYSCESKENKP